MSTTKATKKVKAKDKPAAKSAKKVAAKPKAEAKPKKVVKVIEPGFKMAIEGSFVEFTLAKSKVKIGKVSNKEDTINGAFQSAVKACKGKGKGAAIIGDVIAHVVKNYVKPRSDKRMDQGSAIRKLKKVAARGYLILTP